MKKSTKIICTVVFLAVFIAFIAVAYKYVGPKTQEGAKAITIEVVDDKGESTVYKFNTDAEYLLGAMEDAKKEGLTFHAEKEEMGTTIDTINGLTADFEAGASYWGFYVNGEYCNYGVEEQPIADGDNFKIEYGIWTE